MFVKPFQFKPVLSFGKKGSSVGMLNCPWGVAGFNNHRIQMFE